jgi:hypothetical protein
MALWAGEQANRSAWRTGLSVLDDRDVADRYRRPDVLHRIRLAYTGSPQRARNGGASSA